MQPFHFPEYIEEVILQAVSLPNLRHINPEAILVLSDRLSSSKLGQNRPYNHGRSGPKYKLYNPEVYINGSKKLYDITITPKLLIPLQCGETSLLHTVLHELWHINTLCNGGLRRMRHGKKFDACVRGLEDEFVKRFGDLNHGVELEHSIVTRKWKQPEPSGVRVRKSLVTKLLRHCEERSDAAIFKITKGHKLHWNESDLEEVEMPLKKFYKKPRQVITYVCPAGHTIESKIRFRKPRSCAKCSNYFDKRYLFSVSKYENCKKKMKNRN